MVTLSDRLTYVLQHDLGANWSLRVDDSQWYAVVQYLTYEVNDCWQLGGRFEWFRADAGTRVGDRDVDAGEYCEATLGLNYKPHPNMTVRPELRSDWFRGSRLPYDDGTEDDFFTFGVDAIFTY